MDFKSQKNNEINNDNNAKANFFQFTREQLSVNLSKYDTVTKGNPTSLFNSNAINADRLKEKPVIYQKRLNSLDSAMLEESAYIALDDHDLKLEKKIENLEQALKEIKEKLMEEVIKLNEVDKYNKLFGLETRHPLVSVVDLSKATQWPEHFKVNYGVYALYLKDTYCGNITYGRQSYDYQDGTIVGFAPGQVAETEMLKNIQPNAHGILFHPDLIRGTALGQEIKNYSFFSYETREALHLSEDEREIVMDCLHKIETELRHSIDKHSRRLICANIGLLLDYCMRFYERQFTTREQVNKDIIVRFERLLDDYFDSDGPLREGLPTVKYFADKVFLSANYFGDMIRKQTGQTASEYIQNKLIERAKEALLGTDKTTSEIAYGLGFQYPQHLSRMFKRVTGYTPNEFRSQN